MPVSPNFDHTSLDSDVHTLGAVEVHAKPGTDHADVDTTGRNHERATLDVRHLEKSRAAAQLDMNVAGITAQHRELGLGIDLDVRSVAQIDQRGTRLASEHRSREAPTARAA